MYVCVYVCVCVCVCVCVYVYIYTHTQMTYCLKLVTKRADKIYITN
jgi:hypothetical protein